MNGQNSRTEDGWLRTAGEYAGLLVGGTVGMGAACLAWSAFLVNHRMHLPEAISAPRRTFEGVGGESSFYVDDRTAGRPLVLIHSINAAASAYEMRPLFERFRRERPVFAPDLPGFGFSNRNPRPYSPELYVSALLELVEDHIVPQHGPVDIIALSLSCEFVAMAAARRPDLFRSIVFISPTGFDDTNQRQGSQRVLQAVEFPLWSQAFFDLLVSRPSIRHYLQKSFAGPVDARLAEYDFLTSHQPGARHAPFYFLSGHLFTPRIRDHYASVSVPVLLIANEDDYVSFDALPTFIADHPAWHVAHIPGAKSLPHFENPEETAGTLAGFWQKIPESVSA